MIKNLLKNKKKLLVIIGCILGLCILLFLIISIVINKINNVNRFKREYEMLNDVESEDGKKYLSVNISDNNKFVYTNVNQILNIFNTDGNAVIFFSYPFCLYCRIAIQVLSDTVKDMNIGKIYYLDVENKVDGCDKLMDILGDKFVNNENNTREIYSPLVVFVAYGDIVSHHRGTLFSQETPYNELDKFQIDGLSEIFRYGIRDVINAKV